MPKHLVIVESPTKAKTLRRFLGDDYLVEATVGHVRDLPENASQIPAAYKKEKWARLGVNVDDDFAPLYVVSPEKKKHIAALRKKAKGVERIYLATDEDREGEAISWHVVELLKPKVPVERMVFHEITRQAIAAAVANTRAIDENLVQAQETRRIIDRLYGYEVSPILWRKIAPRLSAGRVQSVAIRMVVEREQARMRFRNATYWDLAADFGTRGGAEFRARLVSLDGKRMATGRDFDADTGRLKTADVRHVDEALAKSLTEGAKGAQFRVANAEQKPFTRSPYAPFTTSTLQQEGNRKLRFDARRTMRAAQRLYENGLITYMRTDSVNLSSEAVRMTREAIREKYGASALPSQPRVYRNKVKNAQEAHEAIRPAGDRIRSVPEVRRSLGDDEARLYELIWKRTMACQMRDAKGRRMVVDVAGRVGGHDVVFRARGSVIDRPGFLRAYVEGSDDPEAALADKEVLLPPVSEGDDLDLRNVAPESHTTTPPARLTEATLVKALEESGIGRPSTYASIIDTIQRREYTFKKGSALVPTFTAFAVVALMTEHLTSLIDPRFTARMEDRLDAIARGEEETLAYLRDFYGGDRGLKQTLETKVEEIDPRSVCTIPLGVDENGETVVVRVGRYGPYLQRGDEQRASIAPQTPPDEVTVAKALELLATAARGDVPLGTHPDNGAPIFVKNGRFGPYVQLGAKTDDGPKPKMVSLLKGMAPESVTLETAIDLLRLPRPLGKDAEGRLIEAGVGRYGPYVKREKDYRSLTATDNVLTVSLARALELLAQEKRGRRAAEPIKTFEKVEALEGRDVRLMKGRYGPYVTDGETNASLPRDHADPTTLTVEEAVELILRRRANPSTKRRAKRKPAKRKATKKKATKRKAAKKTARKKTARKTATKKAAKRTSG